MGLFDVKEKDKKPDAKPESADVKDSATDADRKKQIRGLSGFENLDAVIAAAPQSTAPAPAPATDKKPRSKKEQELAETRARRDKAMEIVGKDILAKVAAVPYDVWAVLAQDNVMRLNPAELKELTDSYYLLAQSVDIDFDKPIFLVIGIVIHNATCIATRLKYMAEKERELDEIATPPAQEPVQ